jgi:hypothetical protein
MGFDRITSIVVLIHTTDFFFTCWRRHIRRYYFLFPSNYFVFSTVHCKVRFVLIIICLLLFYYIIHSFCLLFKKLKNETLTIVIILEKNPLINHEICNKIFC